MNVIFGVALAALIIGSVLIQFWPVIEALSGGAAAFLGALVGAAAGLGAILAGALYNAKLNRDENKRLRREEGRALALALRGEMLAVADSYRRHKEFLLQILRDHADDAEDDTIHVPKKFAVSIVVFSKSSDRLGLLDDPELIADLAQFYPTLPAADEYGEEAVGVYRAVSHSREESAGVAISRATSLAEKLKAAADHLAPRP